MNDKKKYNAIEIQKKWNDVWSSLGLYHPDIDNAKNPYYSLYMFPYPSAEGLHMGHAFSGTGADVYSRFMRMQGKDVFHPMGFDAFGIHSENFALKINDHPQNLINRATKKFREQFDSLGFSYDWTHSVNTSDPTYYKWTQWLFVQLFNAGLAEKKKAMVNWCPSCKTVLADEQVVAGKSQHDREDEGRVCERCGTEVEKRMLEQWFFKITKYADRLLLDLEKIDWSPKVKLAQKNWIGKSDGMKLKFQTENGDVEVFTTRPDTLFGATFLALSPEHPLLEKVKDNDILKFVDKAKEKQRATREDKAKEGIFSGFYATNPATNEKIPVWITDYVLMSYGTGAVMGVPAHDERDFEFATKYELPIKQVVESRAQMATGGVKCYTGQGKITNSGDWDGWDTQSDFHKVISWLEEKEIGTKETNYHLRDWLISRQRYWGAPIPMIYCQNDGWQAVPEKDLPVLLPFVENFRPLGTGVSPLAQDENFVKTKCPKCGGDARRETDVCDTFLDSSWYFLRYPSTDFDDRAFDENRTKNWLPVDMYIGGAEHSVLHLLYSRFVAKALFDLKKVDFEEPFTKFRAHGLIIKDGAKMSKSRGNVVNPDEYVSKYGADVLRMYLMFLGPFDQGGDFRDSGIEGMDKFLKRVHRLVKNQLEKGSANFLANKELDKSMNIAIKKVGDDIENLRYNTAIAHIMEFVNDLTGSKGNPDPKYLKSLVLLLAPFAPYGAEELWQILFPDSKSVHLEKWPQYDQSQIQEERVTIAIQVNGKLRDTLEIASEKSSDKEYVEVEAMKSLKVQAYFEAKKIVKTIYVPGKILSFVVS